ncbi:MAG: glycosyltransferase family 2 protein [Actinomycetota bacterium]|nr:glycosyltransferase family 2 protein [Actinomycetota bacterium]
MTDQRIPERPVEQLVSEAVGALSTSGAGADLLGAAGIAPGEARLQATVAADPGALAAFLEEAYERLAPGGELSLTLQREGSTTLSGRVEALRDLLSGMAFGAGFEQIHVQAGTERAIELTAVRSAKLPPLERRQVLSVVMPVYNEAGTASQVVEALLAKQIDGIDLELVIVESNSTDGSREAMQAYGADPRVTLVLEERPQGKGHAVRAGLAAASGDFVLIQDADLEYDLDDYEAVLEPLRRIEAGFVLGYRKRTDGARFGVRHFESQVIASVAMNLANIAFLHLFNAVYGAKLRDPFTMYKVFRRECLTGLRLECNRFDFDWELAGKLLRAGYRPIEVPVTYRSRSFSEGKKVSVLRDPWSWVVACFKYRFAPLWR